MEHKLSECLKKLADTAGTPANSMLMRCLAEKAVALEQGSCNHNAYYRPFLDVQAFCERFGFPTPEKPKAPSGKQLRLRIKLIKEEAQELTDALALAEACPNTKDQELPAIAQEAIDLLYVTYGALVDCGIRPAPIWDAVHAANMLKEQDPEGGKVRKPVGWEKPDIKALVQQQIEGKG